MEFHLPTKPYSVIDAINRVAAGQGSIRYAQMAADSDYNGHAIGMSFNDYRRYYVAEYFWGERVVIARGSAETVLDAVVREFTEHQGRGASLSVRLKVEDSYLAAKHGLLAGREPKELAWRTPLHFLAGQAHTLETKMGVPAMSFLANSKTVAEYESKLQAHYTAVRAAHRLDGEAVVA